MAARGEVAFLDALLRALDLPAQHLILHRHGLAAGERLHHVLHAFAAEQAHEVVLKRDIEPGRTRVALPPAAPAQLVVDPAALVPLGADNI